jgi:hypothetical protein
MLDISWQYILGSLTDEYDLDLSVRDKPTLGIEDLLVILRYHWCLDTASVPHERYTVQMPLLIFMTAFTASRPGALVESSCARGSNEALRYRNMVLRVLANPNNSNDRILAIEVSLHVIKGRRNKSRPTTYIFHECDDYVPYHTLRWPWRIMLSRLER